MARKEIYVCDHCGAEFHPMNGYTDMEVDDFDFYKSVDLCSPCYDKIAKIVKEFLNGGKE